MQSRGKVEGGGVGKNWWQDFELCVDWFGRELEIGVACARLGVSTLLPTPHSSGAKKAKATALKPTRFASPDSPGQLLLARMGLENSIAAFFKGPNGEVNKKLMTRQRIDQLKDKTKVVLAALADELEAALDALDAGH